MLKSSYQKSIKGVTGMTTSTFFDLTELLDSFDDGDWRYRDVIEKTDRDIVLKVKSLKNKFPVLQKLPDDLSIFLIGNEEKRTLFVGKNEQNEVVVFDCENNVLDYEIDSFTVKANNKYGDTSYAFIKVRNDFMLKVSLELDEDYIVYLKELIHNEWNKENGEVDHLDKDDVQFSEKLEELTKFKDKYGNEFANWIFEGDGIPPNNILSNRFYPYNCNKKVHEILILDNECRVIETIKKHFKNPKTYFRSEKEYRAKFNRSLECGNYDDFDGDDLEFDEDGECVGDSTWDYPGSPYLSDDDDIY